MLRPLHLSLLVTSTLWAPLSLAEDNALNTEANAVSPSSNIVASTDRVDVTLSNVESKEREIDRQISALSQQQNLLNGLKLELGELADREVLLQSEKNKAKANLDNEYRRLDENPSLDLSVVQRTYQAAWAEVKENLSQQANKRESIEAEMLELARIEQQKLNLQAELVKLKEAHTEARVQRLAVELTKRNVVEVSHTEKCSLDMTLRQCSKRAHEQANQQAFNVLRDRITAALTEKELLENKIESLSMTVQVSDNQVVKSTFIDATRFMTDVQMQMQLVPNKHTPCELLEVSNKYCSKPLVTVSNDKDKETWVELKVRSNKHQDRVLVDNVYYGNSPVRVYLPKGIHNVTVEKGGYESYLRTLNLNEHQKVWAELLRRSDVASKPVATTKVLPQKQSKPQVEASVVSYQDKVEPVTVPDGVVKASVGQTQPAATVTAAEPSVAPSPAPAQTTTEPRIDLDEKN